MASPITSAAGMNLSVGDYVRYPNPSAGAFPAFLIGVVTSTNPGANTFNATYLTSTGTTGTSTAIAGNTAHQLAQASGSGNSETVAFSG